MQSPCGMRWVWCKMNVVTDYGEISCQQETLRSSAKDQEDLSPWEVLRIPERMFFGSSDPSKRSLSAPMVMSCPHQLCVRSYLLLQ